ncbi:hypothetical protein AJ78_08563 [Emergomyces pasteurianus Ep9510]|uniref:Uncharacterized protein n=1 Tax=Emergomyces pasteurianus Ep9510 TaxID=1447872 RepID=A0A1J9P2L9_9EURO|nr:hypothetical protein AJ78_08563 [Emergomyces pasteurianus Ep9510]
MALWVRAYRFHIQTGWPSEARSARPFIASATAFTAAAGGVCDRARDDVAAAPRDVRKDDQMAVGLRMQTPSFKAGPWSIRGHALTNHQHHNNPNILTSRDPGEQRATGLQQS